MTPTIEQSTLAALEAEADALALAVHRGDERAGQDLADVRQRIEDLKRRQHDEQDVAVRAERERQRRVEAEKTEVAHQRRAEQQAELDAALAAHPEVTRRFDEWMTAGEAIMTDAIKSLSTIIRLTTSLNGGRQPSDPLRGNKTVAGAIKHRLWASMPGEFERPHPHPAGRRSARQRPPPRWGCRAS